MDADMDERRSEGGEKINPLTVRAGQGACVAGPGFEPGWLSRRIYSPLPFAARASCWVRHRRVASMGPCGAGLRGRLVEEDLMADPSFGVVSKVDRQEVDNALNQAAKELAHRFAFRGTGTSIAWAGEEAVTVES